MSLVTSIPIALLLCVVIHQLYARKQTRAPSLPSPPGDPILGHLRYMPDVNDRDTVFYDWGCKYGDVFQLNVLGKPIVVINSEKAAMELMEKRSAIYSDRPPMPLFERDGWKDGVVAAKYGPLLTRQRKMFHSPLAKGTMPEYEAVQEQEVNFLLQGLLDEPHECRRLFRLYTSSILTTLIYGHRIRSFDDAYYKIAEDFDLMHEAAHPSLLDISPYFEYLPSWFPGAWFIRHIKEMRPKLLYMMRMPLESVWLELSGKVVEPSYASRNLEALAKNGKISDRDWWIIEMTSNQLLTGGTDTSFQTLQWFIVCMLTNPDAQVKAQREIDDVVGRDRLPNFADQDSLPYVQCIMHEVMRWQPVVPVGIAHQSTAEDIYEGMRIPKGSVMIANPRGVTWDENLYHNPRQFKPERFLPKPDGAGENFPVHSIFGWGRRICPGRHLAEANIWLAIARILSVFTVTKAKDENGKPIEPVIKWGTGLVRHPEPFVFDMLPRDGNAPLLIRSANSQKGS
ncbi:cytochrome P450 [Irpex rosettiformis]|uniref:Cytochrome P450 n=1 Tax=Irpex rosettiformis TaxID=378272 RepID=A0ACB8UF68_9APHY|nr:cytochrome P450 [Irpex rosettiformis]